LLSPPARQDHALEALERAPAWHGVRRLRVVEELHPGSLADRLHSVVEPPEFLQCRGRGGGIATHRGRRRDGCQRVGDVVRQARAEARDRDDGLAAGVTNVSSRTP
jgi:hypothetical protein